MTVHLHFSLRTHLNPVPNQPNSIQGQSLTCIRNGRQVLKGLSFELTAGQALLLMGPNGSGKSTLLRICAGLLQPDSGELRVDEEDGVENPAALHAVQHYVGHNNGLKTALTIRENLEVWSSLLQTSGSVPDTEKALDAFGLLKLAETPVHYLSAGQRRRAALSRLLLVHRPLWLLDEPLNALDQKHIDIIEGAIARHTEQGGMAIVATHQMLNLPEAERSALHLGMPR